MTTLRPGTAAVGLQSLFLSAPKIMVSTNLEVAEQTFEPLKTHPELASIAAELLWRAGQLDSRSEFLVQALPLLQQATGADFAALVSSDGGHWTAVAKTGVGRPLPIALLADVLDRESAAAESAWVAAPLVRHAASGELLLLHGALARTSAESLRTIEALSLVFASALDAVRRRQQEHARIKRLEAILEIASQWGKTNEMEPLLKQMAEAATRLLLRPGQHLPLGPAEQDARRPPGAGGRRGRAADSRRLGRRRAGGPLGRAAPRWQHRRLGRHRSPGRSPARLSNPDAALRSLAPAGASCSARSK